MNNIAKGAVTIAGVALLAVPLSVISQSRLAAQAEPTNRPNVVVIITDDQDVDSLPVMRNLMSHPGSSWINFPNAFVNQAVCCPSRASILTGQYAHNHNATGNEVCDAFDPSNTLPIWLDDAGYETALIGKYLNSPEQTDKPPGWDIFEGLKEKSNEDWLSDQAVGFIEQTTDPFFLYLAYGAPHRKASPPARYSEVGAFVPPDRPNFNEADFSDKPVSSPLLTAAEIDENRAERLNAQRELLAVDDGVQRVLDALDQRGVLDNTLIIFLSDHGYEWGSHRHYGKLCPYEECIKIPLMVRYPGTVGNRTEPRFVSNVDLAWTIADFAGVVPQLPQDGRSLMPLLDRTAFEWTDEVLLERHNPIFYGIRTQQWKYVEHLTGEAAGKQELYYLVTDPFEMENLAGDPAYRVLQQQLAERLHYLQERPPVVLPPIAPTPTATPTPAAQVFAPAVFDGATLPAP